MALMRLNEAQSAFLNFLRAGGAMLVVFSHVVGIYMKDSALDKAHIGVIGVFIFFLLSGFLISYSVVCKVHDDKYKFRDYFSDRFCRIFCAFIPALFFVAAADLFSLRLLATYTQEQIAGMYAGVQAIESHYSLASWFGNLLMLQRSPVVKILSVAKISNGSLIEPFGSAGPFWTISIEWWIYMVFGYFAFFWIKNKKLNNLQRAFFAFSALAPFYYLIGGTDECLSCLWVVGMLACLVFVKFPVLLPKFKPAWAGRKPSHFFLVLFVFFLVAILGRLAAIKNRTGSFENYAELQFGVFVAGALFSMLFYLGRFERAPRWFVKVAAFFADYSYSLYLTHATVMILFYLAVPKQGSAAVSVAMAMLVANLFALLFWWLFERHYHAASRWVRGRIRSW